MRDALESLDLTQKHHGHVVLEAGLRDRDSGDTRYGHKLINSVMSWLSAATANALTPEPGDPSPELSASPVLPGASREPGAGDCATTVPRAHPGAVDVRICRDLTTADHASAELGPASSADWHTRVDHHQRFVDRSPWCEAGGQGPHRQLAHGLCRPSSCTSPPSIDPPEVFRRHKRSVARDTRARCSAGTRDPPSRPAAICGVSPANQAEPFVFSGSRLTCGGPARVTYRSAGSVCRSLPPEHAGAVSATAGQPLVGSGLLPGS